MSNLKYLLAFVLIGTKMNSQNLVPNGNFEQYTICPTYASQIYVANSWTGANAGTSDYFNQCATPFSRVNVPANIYGNQSARSGSGYAGIAQYWKTLPHYREYISVKLDSDLSGGKCYYFEMYVSAGDSCRFISPDTGILFSATQVNSGATSNLTLTPQVVNSSTNIPNTSGWTLVSGNYTAAGGERFLIIGNFKNDQATTALLVDTIVSNKGAYIYIDDVSLTACTVNGLDEYRTASARVFPNPCQDRLMLEVNNQDWCELTIFDLTAQIVCRQSFRSSLILNTDQLERGFIFTV